MFKTLFNPDNAVFTFINKVLDAIALSLVWALCCLPILTIGPSCAGLYYAVVKSVRRQRGHAVTEFFRAFRQNFRQGLAAELIILAFAAMMFFSDFPLVLTFLDTKKIENVILLVLFMLKLFLVLGFACWIFPLMSRFRQKLLKLAETALFTAYRHFFSTLLMVCISAAAIFLMIWEPLLLIFVPGLAALLVSCLSEPVLRALCDPAELPQEDSADPWYLGPD